jgi:uncharacterized protein (TIGR00369 family)
LKFSRGNGRVFARVTLPAWAMGFKDTAHGGMVATLLDEAMSWAATCHAAGPTATAEMTVRYRRPTPVGVELQVEAEVVKARGPLMLVEGRLLDAEGQLCATSAGKHMRLPALAKDAYELTYEPGDARIFDE